MKLRRCNDTRGAVMVEFTIGLLLFLGLIGATLDLGLVLWRKMLLVDAVTVVARKSAIHVPSSFDNNSTHVKDYLKKSFGIKNPDIRSQYTFRPDTTSGCIVRVDSEWHGSCFFCLLVKGTLAPSAGAEARVEDLCYTGGC